MANKIATAILFALIDYIVFDLMDKLYVDNPDYRRT